MLPSKRWAALGDGFAAACLDTSAGPFALAEPLPRLF
jgi:hypothetical protein